MFQNRLRELRELAGYRSQQAFADAFGVAQSTVGGWESGKREPNYETTIKLARFFGVSLNDLLDVEEEKAKEMPAPTAEAAPSLSSAEMDLIAAYRAASPDDRAIMDIIIRRYNVGGEGM